MSSGGAPESWDQDVSQPMSKLNVNATEFVPSWLPQNAVPNKATTPAETSKQISIGITSLKSFRSTYLVQKNFGVKVEAFLDNFSNLDTVR